MRSIYLIVAIVMLFMIVLLVTSTTGVERGLLVVCFFALFLYCIKEFLTISYNESKPKTSDEIQKDYRETLRKGSK